MDQLSSDNGKLKNICFVEEIKNPVVKKRQKKTAN